MGIDLSGRTAVVTGAGRGIGRATAIELAQLGANVVVNDIGTATDGSGSDVAPAKQVVLEIEDAGGIAAASTDSVTEYAGAEAIIGTAIDAFGGIDILVNNAGLSAGMPIWEIDPELFRRVCFSHLLGTFNCTRCAVPHMRKAGWGRIVNIVSRAGIVGMAGNVAYGAGKGGVFGLTNVVSRDLAADGITVNAVNPASTETRMVTEAIDRIRGQGGEGAKVADGLLKTMQRPEDVAVLIASLCTEEMAHVNGQIFYVSGTEVGLFQPLRVTQTRSRDQAWTPDELVATLDEFELHPLDGPYT
jgi:NAD(P)-dependent dehydrogenase (short-subunit alcohol dehydrogenase family)